MSANKRDLVGRARGPGEKTFEFQFVTPDNDKVKIGEYVCYDLKIDKMHQVLARVTERSPLRLYPDVMLSNPGLDPAAIATTIDFPDSDSMDYYLIEAQVIGYYKDKTFKFVNPRIPPKPGAPIYLATSKDLEDWLSPVAKDQPKSAFMGDLLSRKEGEVSVNIDVDEIVSKHIAVLAATGSGKSYSVGVLLEEMLMEKNQAAVLVFDPHGEYQTLHQMETLQVFKSKKYRPKVQKLKAGDVSVKLAHMSFGELQNTIKNMSDKMTNLLREAYNLAKKGNTNNFTIQDILDELHAQKEKSNESSVQGIEWRLKEYVENRSIIESTKHTSLRELLMPGQCTIIDMTHVRKDDQQLLTSVILNRVLKSRIEYERADPNNAPDPNEDKDVLDFPVFIVLEEAHRFAPAHQESWSKQILRTILSEGRKFGVGVCVVSQSPGKLDSEVLSQCMSQIIMKMINPTDQKNILNSVESVSEDLMTELPGLTKGQAVIVGEGINTPVLVKIRPRHTKHGGQSPEAVNKWRGYKKPDPEPKTSVDNQNDQIFPE